MQPRLFHHQLHGYFNLLNQNKYFGGWSTLGNNPGSVVMTFPVEGYYNNYAAVVLTQEKNILTGEVYCEADIHEQAFRQATENVSANIDGNGWQDIGTRDEVIGNLQEKHILVRPNLFNSAYEAAAGFVIGNRITIKQKKVIIKMLCETVGGQIKIRDQTFYSFPAPDVLLQLNKSSLPNETKLSRLKFVAEAALSGLLTRKYLLSLEVNDALKRLRTINGIGEFYAQGILFRGAGIVNELTQDDLTPYAIQQAYHLKDLASQKEIETIADKWNPFKMWALVLLHIWLRQEVGMPKRNFR